MIIQRVWRSVLADPLQFHHERTHNQVALQKCSSFCLQRKHTVINQIAYMTPNESSTKAPDHRCAPQASPEILSNLYLWNSNTKGIFSFLLELHGLLCGDEYFYLKYQKYWIPMKSKWNMLLWTLFQALPSSLVLFFTNSPCAQWVQIKCWGILKFH